MMSMELPARQRFQRGRLLRLLDEIETAGEPGVSIYLMAGEHLGQASLPQSESPHLAEARPLLEGVVAASATGAAIFWGETLRCLVLPPFPFKHSLLVEGYDVGPLRSLLQAEHMVALVLLRLGPYAIGVFKGDKLITSKVDTRFVHARHRKGGSSQRRFERGREKQIERLFGEVCAVARQRLEPYAQQIDYLIYGGERHTLLAFRKRCAYLNQLADRTVGRILDVQRPRRASLEAAIKDAWCSEVYLWK